MKLNLAIFDYLNLFLSILAENKLYNRIISRKYKLEKVLNSSPVKFKFTITTARLLFNILKAVHSEFSLKAFETFLIFPAKKFNRVI